MNKHGLAKAVSRRLGGLTPAKAAVEAFVSEIKTALVAGQRVTIPGFGVFDLTEADDRMLPVFRPGKQFRDSVANATTTKSRPGQERAVVGAVEPAGAWTGAAASRGVNMRKAFEKTADSTRRVRSERKPAARLGSKPGTAKLIMGPGFPTKPGPSFPTKPKPKN